ncbi:hypothetical protein P3T22_004359 [Paraburkholderia sp. GAS348]
MASSMGPADRRHATVRPVLLRVMRPASDSTSRCFITAGKDIAKGSASSLTDRSLSSDRRASNARRVGSDSAAKVRSSSISLNLTMRLSIETRVRMSRTGACLSQSAREQVKESGGSSGERISEGDAAKKIRGASQIKPCNTPRQGGEQPTTRSSKAAKKARATLALQQIAQNAMRQNQIAQPPR